MNKLTDRQLLADYAAQRSEAAFAELVRRHVDLVHSAALRLVRDAHTAHDVTQGVFLALAQNARQLTDRPALEGWLHGTTRNLAANAVRSDVRRRAREQEAALMNELLAADPDARWEHIAPHLDEALGELSEPDREALLLRYFKNHDLRTVGATLGISDDAAQKRVSRAVERLRECFAKRGLTVGASGLVVVISANAVQAAPVGLAVTISTAAALASAIATAAITTHATMNCLNLKSIAAILAAAITAGTVTHFVQERGANRLRGENQSLHAQQENLTKERDAALNAMKADRDELERLKMNQNELLRLRGEVARLKRETAAQAVNIPLEKPVVNPKVNTLWTQAMLHDAGQSTPDDTLQTFLYSIHAADGPLAAKCLTSLDPTLTSMAVGEMTTGPMFESISGAWRTNTVSYKVLATTTPTSDTTMYLIRSEKANGGYYTNSYCLKKDGDSWKLLLNVQRKEGTLSINGFLEPEALGTGNPSQP